MQDWNNMMVSKWRPHFYFWVTYPFKRAGTYLRNNYIIAALYYNTHLEVTGLHMANHHVSDKDDELMPELLYLVMWQICRDPLFNIFLRNQAHSFTALPLQCLRPPQGKLLNKALFYKCAHLTMSLQGPFKILNVLSIIMLKNSSVFPLLTVVNRSTSALLRKNLL